MKNSLLLLFLLCCSVAFAQVDTCESYTQQALEDFYQTYILNNKAETDTLYFNHGFYVEDKVRMVKFAEWAEKNGYKSIQKTFSEAIVRGDANKYMILIEKPLLKIDMDYFKAETTKIVAKRKELGIEKCNGTNMGAGASIVASHK